MSSSQLCFSTSISIHIFSQTYTSNDHHTNTNNTQKQRWANQLKHHTTIYYPHVTHLALSQHMHKLKQINNPSHDPRTKTCNQHILPPSNIQRYVILS